MRVESVNALVGEACPPNSYPEQWDLEHLKARVDAIFGLDPPVDEWVKEEAVDPEMFVERIQAMADAQITDKVADLPPGTFEQIQKSVLLQSLDLHWKEHLQMLDALRQVIHLRAYAQKKPLDEYKHEAFQLFERMLAEIREDVTRTLALANFTFQQPEPLPEFAQFPELQQLPDFITHHIDPFTGDDDTADVDAGSGNILSRLPPLQIEQPDFMSGTNVAELPNVSRNAPCPCGSGLKYKHCHGQLAEKEGPERLPLRPFPCLPSGRSGHLEAFLVHQRRQPGILRGRQQLAEGGEHLVLLHPHMLLEHRAEIAHPRQPLRAGIGDRLQLVKIGLHITVLGVERVGVVGEIGLAERRIDDVLLLVGVLGQGVF
jgi:hypothetical protein